MIVVSMNNPDTSQIDRRRRVGRTALICLCVAAVGLATSETDTVWSAAAMRIGIVLGALWLCFPTATRPAAWTVLTRGRILVLVVGAIFWNRLKYAMPFIGIAAAVIWFIRPRTKR